jgi:phage gpG-like protein
MAKVYFHGSRSMAKHLARRVVRMLTGQEPDDSGVARGVFLTLGFAALNSIKQDFIVKSRGGTGVDGVKWAPLTKEYLAYGRRFGRGEQTGLKKTAGLGKEHRFGIGQNKGLLTAAQQKEWQKIFGTRLARLSLSMPLPAAKARAAAIAWATLKRQGAKTKLEVYGNRQVEILRDTGVLFNSLSPGQLDNPGPNATYAKPTGDGGDQQVFQVLGNGVIVGTNVPYAEAHQEGKKPRPFLPTGEVPDEWEQNWLDAGLQAVEVGARMLFEAA